MSGIMNNIKSWRNTVFIFYFYLVVGITLIALELITTTFYLLLIGLSCLIASLGAVVISGWFVPTFIAGFLSIVSCVALRMRHVGKHDGQLIVNHIGQEVEVIEVDGIHLKVFYSGTYWDALSTRTESINKGDKLKIVKFTNHQLNVE